MNDLIDQIIGHLGAAQVQRSVRDDPIIASHIDQALTAAKELREKMRKENAAHPRGLIPLDAVGIDSSVSSIGKVTL